MKRTHGLLLAFGAAALATTLGGDLAAQRRGGGGAESLPQVVCASGARAGSQAIAAQAALNRTLIPGLGAAQKQGFYTQTQTQANAGIAADPNNPFNYFLAAQAAAGLGDPMRADSLFKKTLQLCPEFASEVTPARGRLADQAMEAGRASLMEHNDTTAAIAAWTLATQLDSTNADANFYVAYFSLLKGDNSRAVPLFRRLLAGPAPAANDTNALERRDVAVRSVLQYGGELFNRDQNQQALEVLNSVRQVDPKNHDAAYWAALTYYKLERWTELRDLTQQVVQLAPLNYNAYMLLHDAHKSIADQLKARGQAAQEQQERLLAVRAQAQGDSLPVQVENISISTNGTTGTVRGTVKGNAAAAGTPVRLEITLSTPLGDVGSGTVNVVAPAKDASANFELPITVTAAPTGYRYRLVH